MKDYLMITPEALTEEARKIAKHSDRAPFIALGQLTLLGIPFLLLFMGVLSPIPFVVAFAIALILVGVTAILEHDRQEEYDERQKELVVVFKSLVVNHAAQELFRHYSYDMEKGIAEDEVPLNEVLPYSYFGRSTDLLTGFYRGVEFRRADLEASAASTHVNFYSTNRVFLGQYIDFPCPVKFSSTLYIYTKDMLEDIERKTFLYSGNTRGEMYYETGDEAFDKKFRCLTTDQTEAETLLTPEYVRNIVKLSNLIKDWFVIGFKDGRIFLLIDTGTDHLEPPKYLGYIDKMDMDYEMERAVKTLQTVCYAIDRLARPSEEKTPPETNVIDELESYWKEGTPTV